MLSPTISSPISDVVAPVMGVVVPSPSPSPSLCSVPTIAQLFTNQQAGVVSDLRVTGTRNVATGTGGSLAYYGDPTQQFTKSSGVVQINAKWISKVSTATDLNRAMGINLLIIDATTSQPVADLVVNLRTYGAVNVGNAIIDSLGSYNASNVKYDNMTIASGYEIALGLNMANGVTNFLDSDGRSGTLKIAGAFDNTHAHQMLLGVFTGTTLNDSVVTDFNTGSEAFGVTIPSAESWCA